jgi:hypothetical protein
MVRATRRFMLDSVLGLVMGDPSDSCSTESRTSQGGMQVLIQLLNYYLINILRAPKKPLSDPVNHNGVIPCSI